MKAGKWSGDGVGILLHRRHSIQMREMREFIFVLILADANVAFYIYAKMRSNEIVSFSVNSGRYRIFEIPITIRIGWRVSRMTDQCQRYLRSEHRHIVSALYAHCIPFNFSVARRRSVRCTSLSASRCAGLQKLCHPSSIFRSLSNAIRVGGSDIARILMSNYFGGVSLPPPFTNGMTAFM